MLDHQDEGAIRPESTPGHPELDLWAGMDEFSGGDSGEEELGDGDALPPRADGLPADAAAGEMPGEPAGDDNGPEQKKRKKDKAVPEEMLESYNQLVEALRALPSVTAGPDNQISFARIYKPPLHAFPNSMDVPALAPQVSESIIENSKADEDFWMQFVSDDVRLALAQEASGDLPFNISEEIEDEASAGKILRTIQDYVSYARQRSDQYVCLYTVAYLHDT